MSREPKRSDESTPSPSASEESTPPTTSAPERSRDKIPGWAPGAVLGALLVVGLFGGLGLMPLSSTRVAGVASAAVSAAPAPASSPARASASASSDAEAVASAMHLVVTHAGSIMGAKLKITRTRDEALKRAEEALARARKGEDFAKLITEYSDEPGPTTTRGILLNFTRHDAVPTFGTAVFALRPGELAPKPVETAFGFHVILRTK